MSATTVANNQDSTMSDTTTTKDVSRDYKLQLRFTSSVLQGVKEWNIVAEFRCHDLLHVMRHGLFWATSNTVIERGYYSANDGNFNANGWRYRRGWELQDCPEKPTSQCRWVAKFTLFANTVKTLAHFQLRDLRQEDIQDAFAWNGKAEIVFMYENPQYTSGDRNINCWIDELHPSHGSWWFFPMDTLPEYSTLQFDQLSVPEKGKCGVER